MLSTHLLDLHHVVQGPNETLCFARQRDKRDLRCGEDIAAVLKDDVAGFAIQLGRIGWSSAVTSGEQNRIGTYNQSLPDP